MADMYTSSLLDVMQARKEISAVNRKMLDQYVDRWNVTPFQALVDCGIATEVKLAELISRELHIDHYQAIDSNDVDARAREIVDYDTARRLNCMPARISDAGLKVIFVDPTDQQSIHEVSRAAGGALVAAVAPKTVVENAISRFYSTERQVRTREAT